MDLLTSLKILDAVYESDDQFSNGNQRALERVIFSGELFSHSRLHQGELVEELAEMDPARETTKNCMRAMAIGFVVSMVAALLLIVGAAVILIVLKRWGRKWELEMGEFVNCDADDVLPSGMTRSHASEQRESNHCKGRKQRQSTHRQTHSFPPHSTVSLSPFPTAQ